MPAVARRDDREQWAEHHAEAWQAAGTLYEWIVAGGGLRAAPTSLLLNPTEVPYADLALEYARYYSMTVPYGRQRTLLFGSAPLFAAGLLLDAAANSSAKRQAEAAASAQWREIHSTRVVLTDQRILVLVEGTWLEFWHGAMLDIWPDPQHWTWCAAYVGCEPLRLRGPWAPWLCVAVSATVCGRDWVASHAAFAPLRRPRIIHSEAAAPPSRPNPRPELPPS
jgi:hypothetical protein